MKAFPFRALVVAACMLVTAAATVALTPTHRLSDAAAPVDLDTMVPREFGGWRLDPRIVPVSVSPEVKAKLDKIYNQTLSRTYVNGSGERIMLSIAYGGDQSDAMRAHRPEVCYTAQGFQVSPLLKGTIAFASGELPVMRLVAQQGARHEPITYWMTVGDRVVVTGVEQKLAQLRYGFAGSIPDGMLVRISSIGRDADAAYRVQTSFAADLMAALTPQARIRLVGDPSAQVPM